MKSARLIVCAALVLGAAIAFEPTAAVAARFTVNPGESIQAAVDLASPGDTVLVMPGDYTETHGGTAAVRITKRLRLIARSRLPGTKVRILPGLNNTDGIVVEPENPGVDPAVEKVLIKGFTVEGFPNNGIWTRYVKNFKIYGNESIDNLENGIWPTLSANGLVKKNVSYGSLDSSLWIEASENIRVIKNDLHHSPTGLEITVSKNIVAKNNDVHHNTTGIGLYHPSAAGLAPLGNDGDWDIVNNHVHDNNEANAAPPGGLVSQLPAGGGVLVLGVDRVNLRKNRIENNDFYGIAVVNWCLAQDCDASPPVGGLAEAGADDNTYVKNVLTNNAGSPTEYQGLELFAADITYLNPGAGHLNCFARNTYTTFKGLGGQVLANSCKPL